MNPLGCVTLRRARASALSSLVIVVAACSTPLPPPDAGRDVLPSDAAMDVAAMDVSTSDASERDAAVNDGAVNDGADATTSDAAQGCASNAECGAGRVCQFSAGCSNTRGVCTDNGCLSLPVALQYCGCDGRTITGGACRPDRSYRADGPCPDAGASDAGASDASDAGASESTRFPGAVMLWQAPGGIVGWGPAVMVSSDGTVRFWTNRRGFTLDDALSVAPARTERVSIADVDELFDLWTRVDTSMLPHAGRGGECYPVAYVQLMRGGRVTDLRYTTPMSLLPEMSGVWGWFERRYAGDGPQAYCAF